MPLLETHNINFEIFGETVVEPPPLQGALARRDTPTQGHKPYIPYQPCGATNMRSVMWIGEYLKILYYHLLIVTLLHSNMQREWCAPTYSVHLYSRCLSDKTTSEFLSKLPAALASVLTAGAKRGTSTSSPLVTLPTDGGTNVLLLNPGHCYTTEKENMKTENTGFMAHRPDQKLERLQRTWYSAKVDVFYLAWKDSFVGYKKTRSDAKSASYPSLVDIKIKAIKDFSSKPFLDQQKTPMQSNPLFFQPVAVMTS